MLKKAIVDFSKINLLKSLKFSDVLKRNIDKYNSRDEINLEDVIIDDFIDNLSDELVRISKDLEISINEPKKLGLTDAELAFRDILIEVAKKYKFYEKLSEETYTKLSKEISKIVNNKSKYTEWNAREDVKDELYSEVAILLNKNGYPPENIDETYDEVMKQVDNYKKYN